MNQTLESPRVASVLNRLLRTLCRSLGMYVEEIKPWSLAADEPVWVAIGRLAADSRMYAQRVAEAIIEHGGQPGPGHLSAPVRHAQRPWHGVLSPADCRPPAA